MAMIKGITVTLVDRIETGKDAFGEPIYEEKQIKIDNVLVSPSTTNDIINEQDLDGKKVVYTLAIPKGDTHDWEDKEVIFFNQHFKTYGFVIQGIDENIPLDWNKKVMVKRIG